MTTKPKGIVGDIEAYISRFVTFPDSTYLLPLALWTIGTYIHTEFDAFPYLVVTSETKRAGKTRLGEILSFICSKSRMFGAMTAAGIFHTIQAEHPTMFLDEAEDMSADRAGALRSVLNMGYRRGQKVARVDGDGIKEYDTYCPKVFILIGDVHDTLRDRSVIIRLVRGTPAERFTYEAVKAQGATLGDTIRQAVEFNKLPICDAFLNFPGFPALTDRDEEIWSPLMVLCQIFCPERLAELQRGAVDLCTEKTQQIRRYVDLGDAEQAAQTDEYSRRLLTDVYALMTWSGRTFIPTTELLQGLKSLDTAPWRRFQGPEGLSVHSISDLLVRFHVRPVVGRVGKGRKDSTTARGYKFADVSRAFQSLK